MRHFLARFRAFLKYRDLDKDFDQELESHLTMLAEEYIRRGMPAEDAHRAARVRLGKTTQLREAHRSIRGLPFLEVFLQDAKFALRALRKNPGFTAITV